MNTIFWLGIDFDSRKKVEAKIMIPFFVFSTFWRRCQNFLRNLRRRFIFSQVLITAHRLIHFHIYVSNHKSPDLNFSKSSGNSARALQASSDFAPATSSKFSCHSSLLVSLFLLCSSNFLLHSPRTFRGTRCKTPHSICRLIHRRNSVRLFFQF